MMGDTMAAGHSEAVLLLGGNEGDVAATFAAARALLERRVGTIVRASSLHRTAPWGAFADDAPADFLNQVLVVETLLEPLALLDATQGIERELGRVCHPEQAKRVEGSRSEAFFANPLRDPSTPPRLRSGSLGMTHSTLHTPHSTLYESRPIDIDILYYDDLVLDTPRLRVPHPLIAQREFVLIPLKEVAPERVRELGIRN